MENYYLSLSVFKEEERAAMFIGYWSAPLKAGIWVTNKSINDKADKIKRMKIQ